MNLGKAVLGTVDLAGTLILAGAFIHYKHQHDTNNLPAEAALNTPAASRSTFSEYNTNAWPTSPNTSSDWSAESFNQRQEFIRSHRVRY